MEDDVPEVPLVTISMPAPEWYAIKEMARRGVEETRARIKANLLHRDYTPLEQDRLERLATRAETALARETDQLHDREAELTRRLNRFKSAPKDERT